MKIKPILNLNKHFNECEDYSLVNAKNIKLTKDNIITNDNTIELNDTIDNKLSKEESIVGCIPCNTELVIFTSIGHIYRYDETNDSIDLVIQDFGYNGGKITGTFTYNVNNDLIISFGEYDINDNILVPVKTINLNTDTHLNNKLFSLSPEVNIPKFKDVNYIKGNTYKGWYNVFIRYKINKYDYTKWFPIGYPIFVDTFNNNKIIDYKYSAPLSVSNSTVATYQEINIENNFSDNKDLCNISFELQLDNLDINYSYYQLAFVIVNNDSTKIKSTFDIATKQNVIQFNSFIISDEEIQGTNDIITEYYNYYNVQNIINYKNKLYISNYKEEEVNHNELIDAANNIILTPISNRTFTKKINTEVTLNIRENKNTYNYTSVTKKITADATNNEINISLETIVNEFIDSSFGENFKFIVQHTNPSNISITDYETYQSNFINININYNIADDAYFIETSGGKYKINDKYIFKIGESNIDNINYTIIKLETLNISYTSTDLPSESKPRETSNKFKISFGNISVKIANLDNEFKLPIPSYINSYKLLKPSGNSIIKYEENQYIGTDGEYSDRWYHTFESTDNKSFTIQIVDSVILNNDDILITKFNIKINGENPITIYTQNISDDDKYSSIVFCRKYGINMGAGAISTKDTDYYISNIYNSYYDRIIVENLEKDTIIKPSDENSYDNEYSNIFKKDTLLPNEVYNFFIHYVDEYGNYTQGYKINPKLNSGTSYELQNQNKEILFLNGETCYIIKDDYILNKHGEFNLSFKTCDKSNLSFNKDINMVYTGAINSTEETTKALTSILSIFKTSKYSEYKWSHVLPSLNYQIFENNNNEKFFKMPFTDVAKQPIKIKLNNVVIPNNYKGFFISYEKLERITDTALIFKSNYMVTKDSNYDKANNNDEGKYIYDDTNKENIVYIYNDKFDINDKIDINYDFILYNNNDLMNLAWDRITNTTKPGISNFNKEIRFNYSNICFNSIVNKNLLVADSIKNNLGSSTRLECMLGSNINVNLNNHNDEYAFMSAVILNKITKNIYNNKNKTLIKLGDTVYGINSARDESNNIIGTKVDNYTIDHGYNGVVTSNGVIYFNSVLFDDAKNVITSAYTTIPYYGSHALGLSDKKDLEEIVTKNEPIYTHRAFMYLNNIKTYDEYYHESKEYNNKPQLKSYIIRVTDNDRALENRNVTGSFVTPANTTDLFKNNRSINSPIKTYTNYNPNNWNITNYDNRIIQSDVINSESPINNWRKFNVTEYKDINDNKGKITNLVGIGDLFIVHTEHSMFILDVNNYLVAVNKTVKTEDKELLEINHKEVFTSQVGFGGLQDPNAWIVGTFGYIWYNDDTNRFMRYDNSKFDFIDKNIINWLTKTKPTNVRFADDKINNRIIISFDVNNIVDNVTTTFRACISYNYNINAFISIHGDDENKIWFDDAYGTKNKLYLLKDSKLNNISNNISNSCKISVIVNTEYDIIKYLEFISYKLFTIDNTKVSVNIYDYSPVEGKSHVYSGDYLTIYNDLINTNKLDISNTEDNVFNSELNSNWKKPYFHLGNWNINYLIDTKNEKINKDYPHLPTDVNSRLYGNYFIIEFEFNTDKQFEFEELNCQFTTKIN